MSSEKAEGVAVLLVLDSHRLWRWHLKLIEQLDAAGDGPVRVTFAPDSQRLEVSLRLAVRLDQAIGARKAGPFDQLTRADFSRWTGPVKGQALLVVDLATVDRPSSACATRTLVPLYDGVPGEPALWAKVLLGKPPALAILDTAGSIIPAGQPALEAPHALRASAAGIISRLITGLVRAVHAQPADTQEAAAPVGLARVPSQALPSQWAAVRFVVRKAATKARNIVDRRLHTERKWAVAWRSTPLSETASTDTGETLELADFTLLPDDGARFYADPFPFPNGDGVDVFVEEFPAATRRGIIAMFSIGPDGSASEPRPVLATDYHLSYPQVFARDGQVWMLPEQATCGGLILYRAERYPDDWRPVARLIDEPVHDATLFEHEGRLWLTATTQGPESARWGSSWDALSLYSAPTLLGPWSPHPVNPVLIDARAARPAGAVFRSDGKLYRPVQDCSCAYGGALGIAEITRLDGECFTQALTARWAFGAQSGVLGPHTLNRIVTPRGTLEIIDVFAEPRLLRSSTRSMPRRRL